MSEPTPYDLEQDQIIAEHSELLQVSDVAATGNQISYPVVGQPLTDAQWQTIAAAMGSGVISHGGGPYQIMRPSNLDDTVLVTISPYTGNATAILSGYFHELRENMTIRIPPVLKRTEYHICLTYDPLRRQAADGPVSIQVYAGTPPTAGGKQHIVLGKIVRQPNQVLTDAQFLRVRPMISPTAWVLQERDLPDPATQLWGSAIRVHQTGKTFIACSDYNDEAQAWSGRPDKWEELDPSPRDTGWMDIRSMNATQSGPSGFSPQMKLSDGMVKLRGTMVRSNGENFTPLSGNGNYYLGSMYYSYMTPAYRMKFRIAGNDLVRGGCDIAIGPDGSIRAYPDVSIREIYLDGIMFEPKNN